MQTNVLFSVNFMYRYRIIWLVYKTNQNKADVAWPTGMS